MLRFDHIALETDNISEAITFYRKTFTDLEVLYEDATWGLVSVAGTKVAFVTPGEHPNHIAFTVDSLEELTRMADSYSKKIKLHRDHSQSFYITDPSANAIEFVWYGA